MPHHNQPSPHAYTMSKHIIAPFRTQFALYAGAEEHIKAAARCVHTARACALSDGCRTLSYSPFEKLTYFITLSFWNVYKRQVNVYVC